MACKVVNSSFRHLSKFVASRQESASKTDTNILDRWDSLTPIQRNEWICWVTIVKNQKQELNIFSV